MGGSCCVMDNSFGDFFRDLFCSDSPCGYHPRQVKTTSHAKKTADELAEMRSKAEESTKKSEKKILGYVEKYMERLLNDVEAANKKKFGGRELNINIDGIRAKNDALKREVIGFMATSMSDRLVETDPELSLILQEPDDKKRHKSFDTFYKRIRDDAIDKLADKISQTVKSQQAMIEKEITSRLNEVDIAMNRAETSYIKMQQAKYEGEEIVAKDRANHLYAHELAEILLETVNE